MATASIILPVPPPSFDVVSPARLQFYNTGAEQENHFWRVLFDPDDSQWCYWQFQMPANFASALTIHVTFTMTDANTTDDVMLRVETGPVADSEATEGDSYDAANNATITVDDVAGDLNIESWALSNSSVNANEFLRIKFGRTGDIGGDTALGDLELLSARLDYTVA